MKFVKILILCICFMYAEAFHNFRMSERKKHSHIADLQMRLTSDKRMSKRGRPAAANVGDNIPPYVRKYNRRFKSLYETMHKDPQQQQHEADEQRMMRQYERNFRLEKKRLGGGLLFGHFQKYKTLDGNDENGERYRTNELPEGESAHKSERRHKKHRKHYHSHHHHKIRRLRNKPEAGIMQKRLKI